MTFLRRLSVLALALCFLSVVATGCGGEEGTLPEETGCESDADCTSGKCNTTTGLCEVTDPCNGTCTTGQTCDTSTTPPSCVTPVETCEGTGQSTCSYGKMCSADVCEPVPVAEETCANFSASRPEWSAASSVGPVIYEVGMTSHQANSAYCQPSAPDAFLVRVRAYRTDTDWPASRSGLSGFFYVNVGGTQFDIVNGGLLVPSTGYNRNVNNLKDAEFNLYVCLPANTQSLSVGYYFTGGNPVCSMLTR